jgi:hypothetical protein
MMLNALTIFHVALSLIGIGSGVVAIYGLLKAETSSRWTPAFLTTTTATSLRGFLFPFHGVTPAQVLGFLSLIAVMIASLSIYRYHLQGIWRRTYAVTAVTALYFNVVVLVVQTFRRVPALRAMAPTESEPPFQITQLAVLLLFAAIGIHAATARLQAGLVLWFTSPRGAYK